MNEIITICEQGLIIDNAPYEKRSMVMDEYKVSYYDNGSMCMRDYSEEDAFELSLLFPSAEIRDEFGVIEKFRNHLRRLNPKPTPINIPQAKTTPREYQKQSVAFALTEHERGYGSLLAADPGTGKTAMGWYLMSMIPNFKLALVSSPKRVVDHWAREYSRHITSEFAVISLNQRGTSKKLEYAKSFYDMNHHRMPVVIILNHESTWRKGLKEWFKNLPWDLIVVDECHRLQSPSGKFSRFMGSMAYRAQYRVGLSGLPLTNNFGCLYGMYRFLNPKVFGTRSNYFKAQYQVSRAYGERTIQVGYKNLYDLYKKYHSLAFRIRRDDVLELPPMETEFIEVELSSKERKIYQELEKDRITMTQQGIITAGNCLVKTSKLRRLVSGHAKNDDGKEIIVGDSKILAFRSWLRDFPKSEPLVIFAEFTLDIHRLKIECQEAGRQVGVLSGSCDDYEAWQMGEIDTIICQESIGSVGLDDLKRSRYMLSFGSGWSLQTWEQKAARLRRFGQERSTVHYVMVAKNTIDEKVHRMLSKHKKAAVALIDGMH